VSLRARLLVVTVLLVTAGLLVADVATYRALRSSLYDRVDEQLAAAARIAPFALEHGDGGPGGPGGPGGDVSVPAGTYAELRDAQGLVVAATTFGYGDQTYPAPELGGIGTVGAPQTTTVPATEGRGRFRVLAAPTSGGGTLLVAVPLSEASATLRRLFAIEVLVTITVVGLAAALASWLVRVGLRPLDDMGATARQIADGDLTRRVEPEDDRTEVGRLGASLNTMLARIEEAFEERRESEERLRRFVADASHELRTPLTSIRGYAELFHRGAKDRPQDLDASMRRIEAEAARMGILVEDLLLLARMDQDPAIARDPVDLTAVADEAVRAARAVEPGRPIQLHAPGPAIVTGDAARLRQVLDNLLDNARTHTPAGAPVEVGVDTGGDLARLVVRDHGPGLAPEEAERIFERFYRGDPSRTRATGGAGLGLSIVATIVEAHGGTLGARTPVDGGLEVTVELPRSPDAGTRGSVARPDG
jgi:two-component system OmpR family sensor kinase